MAGRLIAVAVDPGEESLYALTWCLDNVVAPSADAGGGADTLVLVYARPPRAIYPSMDGTGYLFSSDLVASMDKYGEGVSDAVMERAKAVCDRLPNVKVESRVEMGDPRDVICQTVEKLKADMLVLGSHGYGVIKRAFLGSVSNYCAQNVRCPVLIVKKPKQ